MSFPFDRAAVPGISRARATAALVLRPSSTGPSSLVAARAFCASFALALVVVIITGDKPFYFDSGEYWELGNTFISHNHFSLLNFDSAIRGYLWPLVAHLLHQVALGLAWSSSLTVRFFNAAALALLGSVLAPKLAEVLWPRWHWGVVRRSALASLLLIFWSGYLAFPLSDLPALALGLLALVALTHRNSPAWSALAGASCAAAIDMRPSYVLLAPAALALCVWHWYDERASQPAWRPTLCLGLLVGAFALVSLPQSLASHRHFATWSFLPGTAAHLTTFQLTEGLRLERYETYVGAGHGPQMLYVDQAGQQLLGKEPGHVITSTGQYVDLILSHPAAMASLFLRHIVNGFDQRYTTPYVARLNTGSHRLLRLASFTLLFLALLRLLWPAARRSLGRATWRYAAALLLGCLTAVPSAMETRYLLPAYLLGYLLVLAPGWPNPLGHKGTGVARIRTVGAIAIAYAAFILFVWHIASSTSAHLQFG